MEKNSIPTNKSRYYRYVKFGSMIQNRRRELGIKQKDMVDGIIMEHDMPHYESGERRPSYEKAMHIVEKLGDDDDLLHIHYLEDSMQKAVYRRKELWRFIIEKKYGPLAGMVNDLTKDPTYQEGINKQYLLMCQAALLMEEPLRHDEMLSLTQKGMQIFRKNFNEFIFEILLLSKVEAMLINFMAISYSHGQKLNESIDVYMRLKNCLFATKNDKASNQQLIPVILSVMK